MLDIILLGLLALGFLVGLRRGFILQTIHMTGFIISFIVAFLYYDKLAPRMNLWVPYPTFGEPETMELLFEGTDLETAYYNAISFAILFFVSKILLQILGSMLDFVAHLPVLKQLNVWAGGALGVVEVYMLAFLVLYIGALLPIDFIQGPMNDSVLAKTIVQNTPLISEQIRELWFQNIA
ncbi:CvpA family protein [Bacillus fonticola]|uniref:CvpA family protein n=1 Tax=Bacillus fonticola TaxID=2728853 RepID=UPI00147468EE|nr:CvpA family protein [Bacillus fonticola]